MTTPIETLDHAEKTLRHLLQDVEASGHCMAGVELGILQALSKVTDERYRREQSRLRAGIQASVNIKPAVKAF